jgi:NAD(P)-dependent dehydrogenase (short-subunit alcohol dehydrogenase family)
MEINGKKVVVIGGASGMGRASAELLAARGASVAVLDREGSDGKDVAAGIGGTFYPVDVTDFAGTEETLQAAVDKLGGLHVTVTTAGGGIAKRTMSKSGPHDLESFQSVIDLNLIATFNISRLAADHMSKNDPEDEERGVIINTASIAAFEGQIGQVAYTAAKAGIAGMCLTMARDLAKPVRDRVDQGHSGRVRHRADQGRGVPETAGPPGGVRQAGCGHRGQPDAQRPVPAARRRTAIRPQVTR